MAGTRTTFFDIRESLNTYKGMSRNMLHKLPPKGERQIEFALALTNSVLYTIQAVWE